MSIYKHCNLDWQSLKYRLLQNNQFTTLPSSVGNLVNLTDLYFMKLKNSEIYGNQFTTLPPEIGFLSKLSKMYS
jgi:Leucine-rich repeat (LRR) protein